MMKNGGDIIQFDVLIKSRAAGRTPNLKNIHDFKPASDDIEKCRRWFEKKGIILFPTQFGLSGQTTKNSFESVFKVHLTHVDSEFAGPPFIMSSDPQLPDEIAALIDQITLSAPPELF